MTHTTPDNQFHTVSSICNEDHAGLQAAKLTLATLCDMVLGEAEKDRSDDALIRAVRELLGKYEALLFVFCMAMNTIRRRNNKQSLMRGCMAQMNGSLTDVRRGDKLRRKK